MCRVATPDGVVPLQASLRDAGGPGPGVRGLKSTATIEAPLRGARRPGIVMPFVIRHSSFVIRDSALYATRPVLGRESVD